MILTTFALLSFYHSSTMVSVSLWCTLLISGFVLANEQCSLLCASGTCCNAANGHLQCCPASDGICCESGTSCCPQGTVCGSDGFCTRIQSGFFGFMNFFTPSPPLSQLSTENPTTAPAIEIKPNLDSCPAVCGSLCCPFDGGVCCNDGEHCCPSGYQCDVLTTSCRLLPQNGSSFIPDGRVCPLVDSGCRNTDTCCIMFDGTKGCCPYEEADCCADGYHCCPRGTRCTSESNECVPKSGAWLNPFEPSNRLIGRNSVKCLDGKSACHKGSTCCKAAGSNATFACCPLENASASCGIRCQAVSKLNAVCCNDGEHCCPHGYVCDSGNGGSCVSQSTSSLITIVSGEALNDSVGERVMCNDGTYCEGPDVTCCKLADDSWGCCPFLNATCCLDLEHCCPNGYSCSFNECLKSDSSGELTTPWKSKEPAKVVIFGSNTCDDGTTICPSNMTCCLTDDDSYGCCPWPDAVCCLDREHCCPSHYKCDLVHNTCVLNGDFSSAIPMGSKFLPPSNSMHLGSCSPGATPCPTNGGVACCSLENAVCCSDGLHCCPKGFVCSTSGRCVKEGDNDLTNGFVRAPRLLLPN
ncbi:Progranulin [Taenia solium]|eukprot:TsM_000792400 transcript=TsM_000792400 gene=TsM_000792400